MYYDTESALFWYKIIFMLELSVAQFLFTFQLRKKNMFALRFASTCAICFFTAAVVPVVGYNALYSSVLFLGLFFLSSVLLKLLCYDESWLSILFFSIAAYAVQHIAFELYNFTIIVSKLNGGLPVEVYGDKMRETYNVIVNFIHFEVYFIVYWLASLALVRKVKGGEEMRVISAQMFAIVSVTVLVAVVLNAVVTYYGYTHPDTFFLSIVCILNVVCCIFALCLQFGLLSRKNVKQELDVVKNMLEQEGKQYAMLKENIDFINYKCHDLKHQIRNIGECCSLDEKSIKEIQKTVSIYDSALKTGNDALDVLLMEKGLTCVNKGIRFTCVADGARLAFMKNTDIYSLLGNGIDNAIQALEHVEDEQKRVMGLHIKASGYFVTVLLYNYCPEQPVFMDGLPVTRHKDTLMHGFGVKSMRMITEKYGGELSISVRDDIFNLNMLFPIKN